MTGVALAAGIGSAAISAGVGAASSASASSAQRQQAKAQMEYLQRMYGLTKQQAEQMFRQYQANMAPYMAQGQQGLMGESAMAQAYANALPRMMSMKQYQPYLDVIKQGMTPYSMEEYKKSPLYTPMVNNLAELQATPGYQFELEQGQQALAQQAAARGGLLSGAQQRAAGNYAQKQAATGFQAAWERAQQAYVRALEGRQQQVSNAATGLQAQSGLRGQQANMLAQGAGLYGNMANRGYGAAGQLGQAGMNMAQFMGQQGIGYSSMMGGQRDNMAAAGANQAYGTGAAINQGLQGLLGAGLYAYGMSNPDQSIYNRQRQMDQQAVGRGVPNIWS